MFPEIETQAKTKNLKSNQPDDQPTKDAPALNFSLCLKMHQFVLSFVELIHYKYQMN